MRKKGKGGRQPAQDPRLDPDIDPKRAKRILANRQSAARSKLKQKVLMDGLRSRQNVLAVQREAVTQELCHLSHKCRELEQDNHLIRCRVQVSVSWVLLPLDDRCSVACRSGSITNAAHISSATSCGTGWAIWVHMHTSLAHCLLPRLLPAQLQLV